MSAAARLIGERLGHKGGEQILLRGIVFGQVAKKDVAIAHCQSVSVFEVELELGVGIFMVKLVKIPPELVDSGCHLVQPSVPIHETFDIVTTFCQVIIVIGDLEFPFFRQPHNKHFAFDAQVQADP